MRRPRPGRGAARRLLVGLAALGAFAFGFAQVAHGSVPAGSETVTVAAGDTLWEIAGRRYPNADVRQKIDEIERLNGMSEPRLRAGQQLRLPSS